MMNALTRWDPFKEMETTNKQAASAQFSTALERASGLALGLFVALCAPSSQAQTYTVLHMFNGGASGRSPVGGVALSGSTLYGMTEYGGTADKGTIFKLSTNGTGFTMLKDFAGNDGAFPLASLTASGETLFGTTLGGGSFGYGTVFSLRTDGSGHTVLKHFDRGIDGGYPHSELVVDGSTLFGAASQGGISDQGTIFRLNTDGTGFIVLKRFAGGADGSNPYTGLTLSGTTLYGTTANGGAAGFGTVFKMECDGSGYAVLKSFTGADGWSPSGALLLVGETLYGATSSGTSNGNGSLFRLNTDGSGFTVLKADFTVRDGVHPRQKLVLAASGTRLYGVASDGGTGTGGGTVFQIDTDGSGYAVIWSGDRASGYAPDGLVLSGTTLYDTANLSYPGAGCVFSLDLQFPVILSQPLSQTAEVGAAVKFTVSAPYWVPTVFEWFFDGTAISAGRTNLSLELTNVQPSQSGAYTVVVSNLIGSVTSTPAMLQVITAVERRLVPAVQLAAEPGSLLHVECADDLGPNANWTPLETVSITGPQWWFDTGLPLRPHRLYRAWQTGAPGVPPELGLPFMATAITLTGSRGASFRVDGISQIGPTDAWFTLDTVALTNATQLYFDVSAPTQSQRLYRLVPVP